METTKTYSLSPFFIVIINSLIQDLVDLPSISHGLHVRVPGGNLESQCSGECVLFSLFNLAYFRSALPRSFLNRVFRVRLVLIRLCIPI